MPEVNMVAILKSLGIYVCNRRPATVETMDRNPEWS